MKACLNTKKTTFKHVTKNACNCVCMCVYVIDPYHYPLAMYTFLTKET